MKSAPTLQPVHAQGRLQLSDEIAWTIREAIMLGKLAGGVHLNIDRLARELETSTTPVREALLELRNEGFIALEPRRGFRVVPLRKSDVEDLWRLLRSLSSELASRAATRLTDEDLRELDALQKAAVDAVSRGAADEVESLDFRFHRSLNIASDAPKLAWMVGIVIRYVPRRSYSLIEGWAELSVQHDAILDALHERDPERTRKAVFDHFSGAENLVVQHLENRGLWEGEAE